MNQDQVLSLLRTILKVACGYFTAKGFINDSGAEVLVASVLGIVGVVWSAVTHKSDPSAPTQVSK